MMTDNNELQQQQLQYRKRIAVVASLIPRDLFKSEESWLKEIDKVMGYSGMSDADIKEMYNARKVVQQARQDPDTKVKLKSASVANNVRDDDEDKFELPFWIPKVSEKPKIYSASTSSNKFEVPDLRHSVVLCESRRKSEMKELAGFLSTFEGPFSIH